MNELKNVVLETLCEWCDGDGTTPSRDGPDKSCESCGGAGYEPTEFGEKVQALMLHQLRPILARLRVG